MTHEVIFPAGGAHTIRGQVEDRVIFTALDRDRVRVEEVRTIAGRCHRGRRRHLYIDSDEARDLLAAYGVSPDVLRDRLAAGGTP